MYKLLPPETREKVKGEYLLRRTAVVVAAFVFLEVVALVGLFPSFVLSKAIQREVSEKAAVSGSVPAESLLPWLEELNLKLKALNPKLDQDRPSSDLAKALSRKGSGITLENISWTKSAEATTLALSGTAADRQSLLSLQSRLNGSNDFSAVSLPVSNLAKDKNISFEIKLVIKKKQ